MKKTAIIVIVMLIAVFFVTCDEFFPTEGKVEYTDVVYSEDGSRVTIYLDGVGVPVTKEQRAMSTRLSKMAYDYLEAIFITNGATNPATVARAQWELGQSAGISGVARAPTAGGTGGIDYKFVNTQTDASAAVALLAVGRKEGKTLLGIGEIMEVDNSALLPTTTTAIGGPNKDMVWSTGWNTTAGDANEGKPNTPYAIIRPNTKSVTFYLTSVKTGLLVEGEKVGAASATTNPYGIMYSSFVNDALTTPNTIWDDSTRTELGNSQVPTYPLPLSGTANATYTFSGAPLIYKNQIKTRGSKGVLVEPRFPRYQYNGQYRQIAATIDMRTEVSTTLTDFNNVVPLKFDVKGTGIFSFYIEMPVYILTDKEGTNTGKLSPVGWNIRTGLGSELYSLDDGAAGGGCVLMTIGAMDLEDWLEIQWVWLP